MKAAVEAELATIAPGRARAATITTIARKEMLELWRDARSRWAGALLALLMLTALLLGWQQMQRIELEQQSALATTYRQWLDQGDKNPHAAAHFGQYAFKPANPLSFADPGVTPFVGTTVWLEAHKQNEFTFRPARDETSLQRFGDLSAGFVLQVLMPLFVILLAFGAFSGERERGTLRQLLSIGVRPVQLLVGKALAIAAMLGMVLLPMALAGAIALASVGTTDEAASGNMVRMAFMALGYAVYLGGFCALTLGVSAALPSSRQALVALLAFWVANSFVAPRVMVDFARQLNPTPTSVEFQQGIAAARSSAFGDDEKHPAFAAFRVRVLKEYGVARVEDLPVDFRGLALREDDENGYRVYDRLFGELWERYAIQERIRALAGLAFPLAAMQPFSMGMAGTDTAHHNDFAQAAESYRRQIQTAMSDDLIRHRKNGDEKYVAGHALWEKIPPFHYRMPAPDWPLARQWPNAAILLFWALACGLFAVLAVRRLRPV